MIIDLFMEHGAGKGIVGIMHVPRPFSVPSNLKG